MTADQKIKIVAMLYAMPLNEVEWVRTRYCTWGNDLLCYKKFGFSIPLSFINQIIATRSFEETVLGILPNIHLVHVKIDLRYLGGKHGRSSGFFRA